MPPQRMAAAAATMQAYGHLLDAVLMLRYECLATIARTKLPRRISSAADMTILSASRQLVTIAFSASLSRYHFYGA